MKELFLLMASVMPEEMIIKELEKSIAEYKANPSNRVKSDLAFNCMLFSTKHTSERMPGGVTEMIDRSEKMQQAMDLLNPNKN